MTVAILLSPDSILGWEKFNHSGDVLTMEFKTLIELLALVG